MIFELRKGFIEMIQPIALFVNQVLSISASGRTAKFDYLWNKTNRRGKSKNVRKKRKKKVERRKKVNRELLWKNKVRYV